VEIETCSKFGIFLRIVLVTCLGTAMLGAKSVAQAQSAIFPTGLTVSNVSYGLELDWNAAPNASSYNIYRGTAPGAEAAVPIATGVYGTYYDDQSEPLL
jgi:hypothetical protein